ncbi:MAG: CocE/NonD family hydrolase [Chloroflexota bacterium]
MTDTSVLADPPTHDHEVRWDVRIPVRDGLEMAANLWLPKPSHEGERFPAILEMIPYGKDSWRRNSDTGRGEWFAARGFALCRLDVRGTGTSQGLALDEYLPDQTRDGYDAVEWLATQDWSNGSVGMWGISWGGFTSIQVAMLRPPHLRAILPMYATDDRYVDDVHYRGGCATASEKSQYAVSQLGMNAMPPINSVREPGWKTDAWRNQWRERLEQTPPWLLAWMREQTDGPYWRHGSLATDYEALECAVFAIGGWNDSYVDPAFRMQGRCANVPIRTLVGNWVHSYPDDAYPGPNMNWLHEAVRFFGHYLRGDENGWADDAPFTWYEHTQLRPEPFPREWPGRWRAASTVPVEGVRAWTLTLGAGTLAEAEAEAEAEAAGAEAEAVDALPHRATVGTSGPLSWGSGYEPNGLARDLRPDEARGLAYTSEPLTRGVSVIGNPEAVLHLSATMPVATCVVRLSEVAPDGTSALISHGVLNLTHRRSDTDPEPLVPGDVEEVRIPLRATGYRFTPGRRIRLTVHTALWPILWPSPLPGELRVHRGAATPSRLILPVLPDDAPTLEPPAFDTSPAGMREVGGGEDEPATWEISEDVIRGEVAVTIAEGGASIGEDGSRVYSSERLVLRARDDDPAHASLHTDVVYAWTGDDFAVDITATGSILSDAEAFDVAVDLDVRLDGEPFFARSWAERIPRRLV